jgi:hypothetical protein
MSWVKANNFAKYFCDIYSEYITPCMITTYTTLDAIRVTLPRLRILRSRATVWSDPVDNTMNASQEEIC